MFPDDSLKTPRNSSWLSLHEAVQDLVTKKHEANRVMTLLEIPLFEKQEFDFLEEIQEIMKPLATGISRLKRSNDIYFGELIPTLLTIESQLDEINDRSFVYCDALVTAVIEGFKSTFKNYLQLDSKV